MTFLEHIEYWYLKSMFGGKQRIEFYKSLSLLIKNNQKLDEALNEIYNVYSDNGAKPNNIQAVVALECLHGVKEGMKFSEALSAWVGYQEMMVIAAGEETGRLVDTKNYQGAFGKAIDVVKAMGAVKSALMTAFTYPSILALEASFLLHKVAHDLVPKLSRSTNPDSWNGPARLLKFIADVVTGYGPLLIASLILFLIISVVTLPYFTGRIRLFLEKIPLTPWSIYRTFQGSTFLLNVGVLQGSGIRLNDALRKLSERAEPWLLERIEGAMYGVNIGSGLGQALQKSGYDFPDRKAVQFLTVISGKDGANEEIEEFGRDWMKSSTEQLDGVAKSLLVASIAAIGVLMLIVIAGAGGMSDAMISGMSR